MSLGSPHSSGRGQRGCRGRLRPRASGRGRHEAAGPGPDAAARLPGAGARRTCAGARVAEVGPAGALRWGAPCRGHPQLPLAHRAPVLMPQILFRAQDADPEPRSHVVRGNQSQSALLAGLRKFALYELQVQAFTRVGAGVPSAPPVLERTKDDGACAPGPPGAATFTPFRLLSPAQDTKQNCVPVPERLYGLIV